MTLSQDETEYAHLKMPLITFDTLEGDLTIEEKNVWHDGSKALVHSFAAEIVRNNHLRINSANDWTVENAPAGTLPIIGIASKDAEPLAGKKVIADEAQVVSPGPTRQVAVEIFADFVREVPIGAAGTASTRGESIRPHASVANTWEGTGSLSNQTYVVIAGVADGTTVALFGYWGNLI